MRLKNISRKEVMLDNICYTFVPLLKKCYFCFYALAKLIPRV